MEDRAARDSLEDALVGLIAWLAALDQRAQRPETDPETAVIAVDRAVANAFQIGAFPETGPFLAYPGALWWFRDVWRAAAVGPAGVALVADYPVGLVLLLPSDWPLALGALESLCAIRGSLAIYPYAEGYAAGQTASGGRPNAVAGIGDLDAARGVALPFPAEIFPWLEPVLRFRLPV